jgi:hypothetical protein
VIGATYRAPRRSRSNSAVQCFAGPRLHFDAEPDRAFRSAFDPIPDSLARVFISFAARGPSASSTGWIIMIPVSFAAGWIKSVAYVSALSLWALVSGHWAAWQAARVEGDTETRRRAPRRPRHSRENRRAPGDRDRAQSRAGISLRRRNGMILRSASRDRPRRVYAVPVRGYHVVSAFDRRRHQCD